MLAIIMISLNQQHQELKEIFKLEVKETLRI